MLTSSNKNETAVHGCNPAISVLVVLVSHKVYVVRSALQYCLSLVSNFFVCCGGVVYIEKLFKPKTALSMFMFVWRIT